MSNYTISGCCEEGGGGDACNDFWEGNREIPPIPIVFKAERFNGSSLTFNPLVNGGQLEFNEVGTYRVTLTLQVRTISATNTLQVVCFLQPGGGGAPNYIRMVWSGDAVQEEEIQSATRLIPVPSLPLAIHPRIYYVDPNPPDTVPEYGSCWFLVEKICDTAKVKSFISYGGGG
jgi:hypothetical protein